MTSRPALGRPDPALPQLAWAHSKEVEPAPASTSPAWPRAGHKIETTVGPPARVSPRPTAWRTGAATARPAKGAACRRRRAGNGRLAVASRRTGSARAPRFVAVQPAARWLAQAAAAKNATDPTPPGTERRARP